MTGVAVGPEAGDARAMARTAGQVGFATSISRVLGLAREQVFAMLFGAGLASDAFNVAFRIPNLLRDLFAEGALSAAFIPTFARALVRKDRRVARELARAVTGTLAVVVGGVCLLTMVFAGPIVELMAPGFAGVPGKLELATLMTRIMSPFLMLVALAALAMGILNTLGYFFLPALAPAMLSTGMIGVGVGLALAAPALGIEPVVGMAIGVMAGGLGQLLVQLVPLAREGFVGWPRVDFRHPGVREIIALMAPATVGLAATQVNVFVSTLIASLLVQGSVSWLYYAFRLVQLPIGVFGVSVATVSQARISKLIAGQGRDAAGPAVSQALRLVFVLTLPATVGLMVLADPIIALLYQYGRFGPADTVATAGALMFYAPGLAGFSAVKVLTPVYYALGESRLPVVTSVTCVAVNIALNLMLMSVMAHQGLACATSVSGLLNASILAFCLRRRIGGLETRATAGCLFKTILASWVMGGLVSAAAGELPAAGSMGPAGRLALVGGLTAGGAAVYLLALRLLRVGEVSFLTDRLRRHRPDPGS